MLTKITVRNFKRFGEAEIELGNPVVFIGPNNSGKTSALQALALWDIGLKRWNERRSGKKTPEKRPGVTVNRRDLVSRPMPNANLLWHELGVRDVRQVDGHQRTSNVRIDIVVEGVTGDQSWICGLEFDYANEESFYCRPLRLSDGGAPERMPVPEEAGLIQIAFLVAASHSELLLNEAADRDLVVAFVGRPHRIDGRHSQGLKALRDIGFEQYYQAEQTGWVLYLEGSTDLSVLQAFARRLGHGKVSAALERPFVHYVGNQPAAVQRHYHGIREALSSLKGVALFDRLEGGLPDIAPVQCLMWEQREIENYLCSRATLEAYAVQSATSDVPGPLFIRAEAAKRLEAMREAIEEISSALERLGRGSPWDRNTKVSDDFLDPLFRTYFEKLGLPNLMAKKNFYELAQYVPQEEIDQEIREKLDSILRTASSAVPRQGGV